MKNKGTISWVLVTLLAVAFTWAISDRHGAVHGEAAFEKEMATTGTHYTVVETEGHNLIVTDNKAEMLYYYTIDKDAKVGSDLKLRGKLDLKQVGKDVISPSDVKLQK